ncbi:MAG: hypothetical protein OEX03_06260 [Gammaproteobacteria bacterium]|nr:hypothetical protein [Gammaproteobacteria bacterium]
MSWISEFFTSSTSKVVDSIGGALDELFTSDEEELAQKNKLEETKSAFKLRMKEIMFDFEREQLKYMDKLDVEISKRHQNDMQSDSWLSKNIRPMALIFLTLCTMLLIYLTTFGTMTDSQTTILMSWKELLITLLGLVYTFYFGSRGVEKIAKIWKSDKASQAQG